MLILCGMGAIGVLLTSLRRSSQTPSELDTWCSNPAAQQTSSPVRQTGPQAVPILLEWMRRANSFRPDIMTALTSLGPAAVPSLVAAFEDRDDRVRLTAVRAVASLPVNLETQAAVAMPGLIKLLGDPKPARRSQEAKILSIRCARSRADSTSAAWLVGCSEIPQPW